MNKTILEVNNLTKKFSSGKKIVTAVDNISFKISEGEIVGLLGPNGAGKTTTIQMIMGLITPTKGEIKLFDKEFVSHREEILEKVNFSSSYTHLPWRLSVWENLFVVAMLYGIDHPGKKVDEVINLMKLSGVKNTIVNDLSSGWITKVNLARTFLNSPKVLLLDEPTASLDPESAVSIREEITNYRKKNNATILWTSHNMAEVEEVCDRVIFLKLGKIVATDTPGQLSKTIKSCRISLMIESGLAILTGLAKSSNWRLVISGKYAIITISESSIPQFLQKIISAGVKYSEISIDKPTLEDFFISMAKVPGNRV